eukprot:scaffold11976_cov108-Skeletonema_menzelii.AAC.1
MQRARPPALCSVQESRWAIQYHTSTHKSAKPLSAFTREHERRVLRVEQGLSPTFVPLEAREVSYILKYR